jgi:hypothetical protein
MSGIQNFDVSIDLLQNITWQYNEAKHLNKLIQNNQDFLNTNVINFLDDFYTNVFNVDTANDFGLRIWEIILNIDFTVPPKPKRTNNIFGFGSFNNNFFNSNFAPVVGDDNSLSVEIKRLVVKLKYQSFFAPNSIVEVNRVVKLILGDTSYAIDNFNMSVTIYVDSINANPIKYNAMIDYELLPIPAGVSVNYVWI